MAEAVNKARGSLLSHPAGELAATVRDSFQPDRVVTVLAISPLEDDHTFLRNIFSHSNWRLHNARNWREARAVLAHNPTPVVICESVLEDANWQDVLLSLSRMPDSPVLIVSERLADERLWAEVLNLGGYDVLMKPFDVAEVFRVVSLAWLSWRNDRERTRNARPMMAQAVNM